MMEDVFINIFYKKTYKFANDATIDYSMRVKNR